MSCSNLPPPGTKSKVLQTTFILTKRASLLSGCLLACACNDSGGDSPGGDPLTSGTTPSSASSNTSVGDGTTTTSVTTSNAAVEPPPAGTAGPQTGGASGTNDVAGTGGNESAKGSSSGGGGMGGVGDFERDDAMDSAASRGGSGGVVEGAGGNDDGGMVGNGGNENTPLTEPSINDVVPSIGCGKPAFADEGRWEDQQALEIEGRQRNWAVRFPDGYDPARAYPVNFLFHGCGEKTNNVPMENVAGSDAIHVRGASVESCWNDLATGQVNDDTVSYDLPFVQAMIDRIKAEACVDEHRLFGVGYSSGAWLVTHLACKLPGPFRAFGSVAGEDWAYVRNLNTPECEEGNVAQMYIQDLGDPNNQWDDHKSAMQRLVATNGCTPDSAVSVDPSPCERFQGCDDYPVQYCLSMGQGHDRRDDFAPQAFWDFFSELAPRE